MKRFVIVGCGRLGTIVAEAVAKGLLPEYELVGCFSRTYDKCELLAAKMAEAGIYCQPCHTLEELLALRPDYLVEAASPACMRAITLPTLAAEIGRAHV